jgi:hypothetical protein
MSCAPAGRLPFSSFRHWKPPLALCAEVDTDAGRNIPLAGIVKQLSFHLQPSVRATRNQIDGFFANRIMNGRAELQSALLLEYAK